MFSFGGTYLYIELSLGADIDIIILTYQLAAVLLSVAISVSTRKLLTIKTSDKKQENEKNPFEIIESLPNPILLMEINDETEELTNHEEKP
jgi:hypothetical protein